MATRMQQRRGTASQWTSANPVLNAGEMGWESDTNKFKIGDGTNHWADLDYFIDANSTVNPSFGSSITFEGATNNTFETMVQVTDPTADRTITFPDATGTVITTGNLSDITDIGVFTGSITMEGTTADAYELVLSAGEPTEDRTITFPDATGTVALIETVNTSLGGYIETSDIGGVSGVVGLDSNLNAIIPGTSIIIEGTTDNNNETTLTVADPTADRTITFPDATGTVALTSDLSSYATLNSPTFTGTVTLPNNTISQSMMADDSVGTNEIGGLAVTEGKIADGAVTSLKIANDTIVDADINSAAAIAQSKISGLTTDLAAKAPLAGPTFTGTVVLPSTTSIGDVSSTEIGYVNGVTSAIQTQLDDRLSKTGGTMSGAIAMGTNKVTGLGTPTDATDAATKSYVDSVTEGLHIHEAAVAATTANVNLANALENGDTLDGVTLATGNRILVKNQTTQSENGIYVVQASGQPTRATDFDTAAEVDSGDFIFVYGGTLNAATGWVQINRPATIGTDAINFSQFSGSGTYTAGNGLTLTGTSFSIDTSITQARVADVSDTEIGYLNGVTSAIQTQIDAKSPTASPTFTGTVTVPNGSSLGTPTSLTLTNATDLPVSTGVSGLGTGVATFLGTPSSANLIAAVTDETGSGALVFGTSPTIATPTLTLSTTSSTTDARLSWDSTNKKIQVGNGSVASDFASSTLITNAQAASYTLVLADKDKLVEISNASANTLTIPTNGNVAFPIGTQINILQTGAGQTTIAGAGVTINGTPGLKLRAQWSSVTLIKRASDTWVAVGDLTA